MKVTVIGSGYAGPMRGACLSELGNDVVCADVDERKITMLEDGKIPNHEPGLQEMVLPNVAAGRRRFKHRERLRPLERAFLA